jgi:hypothetical protein
MTVSRVTGFSQFFRLLGGCLLWAVLLNYRSSPKFWILFSPSHRLRIDFGKNVLGYILGDFFTYSSGHPAAE